MKIRLPSVLGFFACWPFFIDLATGEFIGSESAEALIPVPVGLFSLGLFSVAIVIRRLIQGDSCLFTCILLGSLIVMSSAAFALLGEQTFVRALQAIILPLLVLMCFLGGYSFRLFSESAFLGFSIFVLAHCFSVSFEVLVNDNPLGTVFSYWFNVYVYQSLVTYPAVVSLGVIAFTHKVFSNNFSVRNRCFNHVMDGGAIIGFVFVVIVLMSQRISGLLVLGSIAFVGFFFLLWSIRHLNWMEVVRWFILMLLLVLCIYLLGQGFGFFDRFYGFIDPSYTDAARVSKYFIFANYLTDRDVGYWGSGIDVPSMHNQIMDLVMRFGVLGGGFIFGFNILALGALYSQTSFAFNTAVDKWAKLSFLVVIAVQSGINASLTQPFFAMSLVIMFIYTFTPPSKSREIPRYDEI